MFEFKLNIPQNEQVVLVNTTDKRGFTPEELAEQCVNRIVSVSDSAHPGIRDQARAFPVSTSRCLLQIICDKLFAVTAQLCIMR
jgi:hypothetical protein